MPLPAIALLTAVGVGVMVALTSSWAASNRAGRRWAALRQLHAYLAEASQLPSYDRPTALTAAVGAWLANTSGGPPAGHLTSDREVTVEGTTAPLRRWLWAAAYAGRGPDLDRTVADELLDTHAPDTTVALIDGMLAAQDALVLDLEPSGTDRVWFAHLPRPLAEQMATHPASREYLAVVEAGLLDGTEASEVLTTALTLWRDADRSSVHATLAGAVATARKLAELDRG